MKWQGLIEMATNVRKRQRKLNNKVQLFDFAFVEQLDAIIQILTFTDVTCILMNRYKLMKRHGWTVKP